MADYTTGDYDMIDMLNKYNIDFILNQIHDVYITSPLNIMEENFESMPNLFLNKILKN